MKEKYGESGHSGCSNTDKVKFTCQVCTKVVIGYVGRVDRKWSFVRVLTGNYGESSVLGGNIFHLNELALISLHLRKQYLKSYAFDEDDTYGIAPRIT
jgi:hypothetical protein